MIFETNFLTCQPFADELEPSQPSVLEPVKVLLELKKVLLRILSLWELGLARNYHVDVGFDVCLGISKNEFDGAHFPAEDECQD